MRPTAPFLLDGRDPDSRRRRLQLNALLRRGVRSIRAGYRATRRRAGTATLRTIGRPRISVSYSGFANPGYGYARLATFILPLSLIAFWLWLPRLFPARVSAARIVAGAGTPAMVVATLVFTAWHDLVMGYPRRRSVGLLGVPCSGARARSNGKAWPGRARVSSRSASDWPTSSCGKTVGSSRACRPCRRPRTYRSSYGYRVLLATHPASALARKRHDGAMSRGRRPMAGAAGNPNPLRMPTARRATPTAPRKHLRYFEIPRLPEGTGDPNGN